MLITDIHLVPAAPPQDFLQYYKGLISAEVVITLDAALCELHLKRCPHTEQLLEVCAKVKKWEDAMDIAMAEAEADYHCIDHLVGDYDSCVLVHSGLLRSTCSGVSHTQDMQLCSAHGHTMGSAAIITPADVLLSGSVCDLRHMMLMNHQQGRWVQTMSTSHIRSCPAGHLPDTVIFPCCSWAARAGPRRASARRTPPS